MKTTTWSLLALALSGGAAPQAQARLGRCNVIVDRDKLTDALDSVKQKSRNATAGTQAQKDAAAQRAEQEFNQRYKTPDDNYLNRNPRAFRSNMNRCGGPEGEGRGERQQLQWVRQQITSGAMRSDHISCYCVNRAAGDNTTARAAPVVPPPAPRAPAAVAPPPVAPPPAAAGTPGVWDSIRGFFGRFLPSTR